MQQAAQTPRAMAPRAMAPVRFAAWGRTRASFATAMEAGPGLVCLIGPAGSGKSHTLAQYQVSAGDRRVGMRTPATELAPGVEVDLVDDVAMDQVASLARAVPPGVRRVLALRPDALPGLPGDSPALRVVRMAPMDEADVRTMVLARCTQLAIRPETFSHEALARLVELSDGTPGRVDALIVASLRLAFSLDCRVVTAAHVTNAAHGVARPRPAARAVLPAVAQITAAAILDNGMRARFLRPSRPAAEQTGMALDRTAPPGSPAPVREDPPHEPALSPIASAWGLAAALPPGAALAPALPDLTEAAPATAHAGPVPVRKLHARNRGRWPLGAAAGAAAAVILAGLVQTGRDGGQPGPASVPASDAPAPGLATTPEQLVSAEPPPAGAPAEPDVPPGTDPTATRSPRPGMAVETAPTDAPASTPPLASPPAVRRPAATPPVIPANLAEGTRLLRLARAMVAVGQPDDAAEMLRAASALGNKEAGLQLAALRSAR